VKQTHPTASAPKVRVLALPTGYIMDHTSEAPVKYGQLFAEIACQCDLVAVYNVELRGFARCQNALCTIRWPVNLWRAAFYQNTWAFDHRMRRTAGLVHQWRDRANVIFQHGALFSADSYGADLPVMLYAAFTRRPAEREDPGANRSAIWERASSGTSWSGGSTWQRRSC
jgi:hypothetical protein